MDHQIIKKIVEDVFEKVKLTSASHKKNALSNSIEIQSDIRNRISYRTAERAYEKYIDEIETDWYPNRVTIDKFCIFLDNENYKDYVEKNITNRPKGKEEEEEEKPDIIEISTSDPEGEENSKKNRKWILTLKITVAFALTVILYQSLSPLLQNKNDDIQPINDMPPTECMAWAKDHYEKTDCDLQLHPKFGTKVEPYDVSRSKMRKIEVNASFYFFSEETGQPLVWYYKTKKGTLEYFNLPGLHPVNGETLRKITEEMIEKHVPTHITKPDSFISSDTTNSTKADATVLQDFDKSIFKVIKSISKDLNDYDKNYQIIIYPFKFNKKNEELLAEYVTEEFWILTPKTAINFEVMDRGTFDEYFKEHKLKSDNLIDPKTAKQFGMLIAADAYVTGKVYVFNSIIKLRATVTDTQTGKIIATQSGNLPITSDIANYIGIKD